MIQTKMKPAFERERYINRHAAASILHGVRSSYSINLPLNTIVTLSLSPYGVTGENIDKEFRSLLSNWFRRWSQYRPKKAGVIHNGAPCYQYSHEIGPLSGAHTHWMVHIKEENLDRFRKKLEIYIMKKYKINQIKEGIIVITRANNVKAEGFKKYMTKGIHPYYRHIYKIRPEFTGIILGKRASTSRNIGPKVWKPNKKEFRSKK